MESRGNGFHQGLEKLAVMVFIAMVIVVILQIFFRYVLSRSLTWSDELARVLFTWTTFVGAAIAMKGGEHICVDLLLQKLSGRIKSILSLAINTLVGIFLLGVIWGSWQMMRITWRVPLDSVRIIKMGYIYLSLLLSAIIMGIYLLSQTYRLIRGIFTSKN